MRDYSDYSVTKVSDLRELLCRSVELYGSKIAFQRSNEDISYHRFRTDVLCVAGALHSRARCFFQVSVDDSYLFAVAYFATVLTDNIAVLLDTRHSPTGIETPPITEDLTKQKVLQMLSVSPISDDILPLPNADSLCTIIYSSGTTSAAKGIMLSQKNLCCDVVGGLEKYRFSPEDRLLQLIPYCHAFGLVCDLLAPLLSGTVICIPDSRAQGLAQMRTFLPTMLNAPPAIAEAILKMKEHTESMDLITGGQLKKILCGGASLRQEVTEIMLEWNINAFGCYGVSECSPCVSVNRDEFYKPGSAGIPLNCNKIRIADDGEIVIRGDNVMLGYYRDLERTAHVIVNGEYYTGDLGYVDKDGFLFVTGRKSNMIVFEDGTKCLPETLEQNILSHPAVQEALVYAERTSGGLKLCTRVYLADARAQREVELFLSTIPKYQPFYRIHFTEKPLRKTLTGKLRRDL